MASVLNQSCRSFHTQIVERKDGNINIIESFCFNPSEINSISDKQLESLKKCKSFEKEVDEGNIIIGSKAKRKGKQLEKDVELLNKKALEEAS